MNTWRVLSRAMGVHFSVARGVISTAEREFYVSLCESEITHVRNKKYLSWQLSGVVWRLYKRNLIVFIRLYCCVRAVTPNRQLSTLDRNIVFVTRHQYNIVVAVASGRRHAHVPSFVVVTATWRQPVGKNMEKTKHLHGRTAAWVRQSITNDIPTRPAIPDVYKWAVSLLRLRTDSVFSRQTLIHIVSTHLPSYWPRDAAAHQ